MICDNIFETIQIHFHWETFSADRCCGDCDCHSDWDAMDWGPRSSEWLRGVQARGGLTEGH